jgi:UV DNA damage endonuclease
MILGYACINLNRNSKTRTLRLNTAINSPESIPALINANLDDIHGNLQWNHRNGVRAYRVSSEIFPHYTNRLLNGRVPAYSLAPFIAKIAKIGAFARDHRIHLSFHCTPYVVLGSHRPEVVEKSIHDLNMYGEFIAAAGVPMNIIIHPSVDPEARARFAKEMRGLSPLLKRSICLENTELVSTPDTLKLARKCGVPLVFDYFHYQVANETTPLNVLLPQIRSTWDRRLRDSTQRQKFHISEQMEGCRPGAHSEYVNSIPGWMNGIVMVEAKKKDKAVMRLLRKYKNRLEP